VEFHLCPRRFSRKSQTFNISMFKFLIRISLQTRLRSMSIAVPTVTKLTTTYRSFMNFFHNEFYANREIKLKREKTAVNLMDVIPLCDITKSYTDIYVNTQQLLLNTTLFYTWRHVSAAHTAIFRPAYNRTGPFMCAQYGTPHCLHIKYM